MLYIHCCCIACSRLCCSAAHGPVKKDGTKPSVHSFNALRSLHLLPPCIQKQYPMHFTAKNGLSELVSALTLRLSAHGNSFSEVNKLLKELHHLHLYRQHLIWVSYMVLSQKLDTDHKMKNPGKQVTINSMFAPKQGMRHATMLTTLFSKFADHTFWSVCACLDFPLLKHACAADHCSLLL